MIHKQIQEIASSQSEPYVWIQGSLAALPLFVCLTAMGERKAERAWEAAFPKWEKVKVLDGERWDCDETIRHTDPTDFREAVPI